MKVLPYSLISLPALSLIACGNVNKRLPPISEAIALHRTHVNITYSQDLGSAVSLQLIGVGKRQCRFLYIIPVLPIIIINNPVKKLRAFSKRANEVSAADTGCSCG